jgi:ATP-binding cassette, subfamily B, bacterial
MDFLRKLLRLLQPFYKQLILLGVITLFFEVGILAGPFVFGKILDILIATNGLITFETAVYVIGGLVVIRLFTLVMDYIRDILIVRLLWRSERHISTIAYNKLLELSIDYHEKVNTGSKINLVNKGKDKMIDLIAAFSWEFEPIVLKLILTSVVILIVSWLFGLIFIISVIPFLFITFKTFQVTRPLRMKRHDMYEISSGEIGDTITNITVVKAFAQEEREKTSFGSLWNNVLNISGREYKIHTISSLIRSFIIEICYITLMVIGILQIRSGNLTVGSLVFLISLTERAYSNIYRLGRIYERAADAAEPVERISSLLEKKPTVKNSPDPIVPRNIDGRIEFDQVTFAYGKRDVLKNISFMIREGSFVALVGKSGSGKSTIAKLLSRYYDPQKGSIVIDGEYDLRDLDINFYRNQTSVVFQDSPVPNRKIWEVISYSAGEREFDEVKSGVIEAAKLAHAHEFISEFEEGYETQIGERGVKLSGGQKQRLAIARALFAQPKILIMDEPTSHLDTLSEAMIQKALEDISRERAMTKIVIAHRLSTVQKADNILVMEKGKLVEQGAHRELLKKKGVYAQIVAQSELKH